MRLIDAEKFEVFDATCQITKGIRSGKTAAYFYGEGCRKVLEAIDAAPHNRPRIPAAYGTLEKNTRCGLYVHLLQVMFCVYTV